MEIRTLDDTALADDAVMRDFYDLTRRSELHGRPDAPFWEFREFLGAFRSPDSGERQELFAVYEGGRMVGQRGAVVVPARQHRQGVVPPQRRRRRTGAAGSAGP